MMRVRTGLEVLLEERLDAVRGKRAGLVAAVSSVDPALVSTVLRLHGHPDITLVALFGPEHGLRGEVQAGEQVATYSDTLTGLPVYSLYGETRQPTSAMLAGLDVLVVDLQDGGVRFFTYLATLSLVMQAAAANGLPVILLDRPAPLGGEIVEGAVLDAAYQSFVGPHPIPLRYGMTLGEIAGFFNDIFSLGCDLTVIPLQGWRRDQWFDQTGLPFIPPSPNLPTLDAMTVYPGTCLVEGTTLSEGRGTTRPFEYVGAPWLDGDTLAGRMNALDLPGVRFRPVYFVPTFSKHQGEVCQGVHLYVTDRVVFRPVTAALHLLEQVKQAHPEDFAWRDPWQKGEHYPIDLLSGGNTLRQHLDAGQPVQDLLARWQRAVDAFTIMRERFLLYPA